MVRQRGAVIAPPPLRQVQGMVSTVGQDAEGHWEGLQVETPAGPLGQATVEGWDNGGGVGIPKKHESGMFGVFEATSEDEEGDDREGKEGGPSPP